MEDMDLLQCIIETEIMKIKYRIQIADSKGQKNKKKALYNVIAGLKQSLNFIEEIEDYN